MFLVQKMVSLFVVGYAAQFNLYGNPTPRSGRLFVASRRNAVHHGCRLFQAASVGRCFCRGDRLNE